jgi:Dolichyl-phosphate-mannose-protein mannosyltransferase
MDDVDAVQAQIARNMLQSGDWVTARLDGVAYLEKSPLIYWMMASSYRVFGVHDWAARMPISLAIVLLCWVVYRFGRWSFSEDAGLYSGLALSTCVGLFLFTRILIPDVVLTLAITVAVWAWLRLLEPGKPASQWWPVLMGVGFGTGLLLKGLIAVVFPVLTAILYMACTRQLFSVRAWRSLRLLIVFPVALLIAVPWHVLATLRNPPYFAFSMHSGPGQYHGFFWFYFFNEHLLRFLNLRYPRDYNTVPRPLFWLLNLVWLFPWSAYLPAAVKLSYQPDSRAGRARLIAVCWIAAVMLFFTFSTTQEYYSMPIYPAVALLIGSAVAGGNKLVAYGTRALMAFFLVLFLGLTLLLGLASRLPATGELSTALTQNPELYTLSMGHMADLTLGAFAYLKLPLALAAIAFAIGFLGVLIWRKRPLQVALATALTMIIFFQAARIALKRFDPYLGSYPLAHALQGSPPGKLIEGNAYYAFSSVFFYTDRTALLWNGRKNNLEYGSYAPGAPQVFIDDAKLAQLWTAPDRQYLLVYGSELPRLRRLLGEANLYIVRENAGNFLFTNEAISKGLMN